MCVYVFEGKQRGENISAGESERNSEKKKHEINDSDMNMSYSYAVFLSLKRNRTP